MLFVKSLMVVTGIFVSMSFTNASNVPSSKEVETTQIRKMLTYMDGVELLKNGQKININFLINAQNEIIVLSTSNEDFDFAIKEVLNYSKITLIELKPNTVYTLPVVFK
ncbi:MAG: hypothetical protein IPG18_17550 [Saprospiraceae bacterium]|nr:hypothetical protein [Saprospiraceae bacterium]MBK6566950.1 hypothetical protein [Saprospiraceae bacterium]MBK7525046.1 hypothetical protein [Saprospiraceae bacterium]MBK8372402.1 hypothetical protein [Saprospiraceae bacterium]MBK8854997.1 hypothetical protein [Saprospiraceae bacterium]